MLKRNYKEKVEKLLEDADFVSFLRKFDFN